MTDVLNRVASTVEHGGAAGTDDPPVRLSRHRLDQILTGLGVVAAAVLLVAGGLLTWGNNFAEDYVGDELAAQNVTFPEAESLTAQGREDLLDFAGEQVVTGEGAEAYASYIGGHVAGIADGATYSDLSGPEREANAAVSEAITAGASAEEVATLQASAAEITGQRDSIFRGEMLRGALLNTYAWSTIGRIAGIAAVAAWFAAAAMLVLVAFGFVHARRHHKTTR